ncbi:MAG: M23 family metallopeptidase [Endozoicomonadaceae bacterium]|nr:M23 family metallopeptidase [Endozoicomonadaceae bacterium]
MHTFTVWADDVVQLTQGGLYRGRVALNSEVYYQDKKVRVTPDGEFILGFGRDAELNQQYTVISRDGRKYYKRLTLKAREYDVQRIKGIAKKYIAPSKEDQERARRENELIGKARESNSNQMAFLSDFIWPLVGPVTGVYGSQRVFNGVPGRPHYGVDVAAATGTPVSAPADGRVVLYHPDMYFSGGTMIIDHGYGVTSAFLHLSQSLVKEGDFVKQGQPVAKVGATGRVTGAHLDWRINWYDVKIDAQLFVPPMAEVMAKQTAR